MPADPLAYFITFSTYGVWLHGRAPGSVDKGHNQVGAEFLPANPARERIDREQMKEPPYLLDPDRRTVVLDTIREVCEYRGWHLWAVHVRTNHVHVVVTANAAPEKVMSDFKAYASRRLKERFNEQAINKRWTQHGSTLYLWNEHSVAEKIEYTLYRQGTPMESYDGRVNKSEAEA